MADFTTLGISKDDGKAICEKMEAFCSLSGKESEYETVGVVRNESTFNMTPEFTEYKDGFSDWLICKTSETFTFEGAFMQASEPKLLALAFGRQAIDSASDTLYDAVNFTSERINPPQLRWKFVGENKDGKDVEIEILKGQIRSDVSLTFGNEVAELPFTIQAVVDEDDTGPFNVARIRVQK
jgi:hypothetical protein